jgi:succinate dehydrogenase/fumarate reductase flavoprotein subunit
MELERRDFLKGAALGGAVAAIGASACAGASDALAEEAHVGGVTADDLAAQAESDVPVTEELPFPGDAAAPETTEYSCDVLVIGCGWAGLHAAVTAARAGADVLVVDKGLPGYSGLSPFSQGCTYYDADYDNLDGTMHALQVTGEYLANLDAFQHELEISKQAYQENYDFGLTGGYLYAPAAGYTELSQDKEYFQANIDNERHHKVAQILEDEGVRVVDHVMICNLLTASDGSVCGAVGLHFQSGTVMTFSAKAVAMCAGTGSYRPSGFVTSGDTFDGQAMAYDLGLTIVGMEFEDFHQTNSVAAGDYHFGNTWDYVEPYTPYDTYTIEDDDETIAQYAAGKLRFMSVNRANQALNGLAAQDGTALSQRTTQGSANPDDPRDAYCLSFGDQGKNRTQDAYGAAPGMPLHMASGVYCGWDVRDGATPIAGLYVAGDGEYGDMAEGVIYPFVGSTSTGCSAQGDMAGASAAAYASGIAAAPDLPADQVQAATDAILAPRSLEKGFDPNYVVDRLVGIMSAPEVQLAKDGTAMEAALTQVEYLRDNVVPKMMGYSGHDLRICIEARHKVLSAEMKLRASLAREESRGTHYRRDFPYRDDTNFLCHLGLSKAEDGTMAVEKIEVPDSWKGDLSADYATRYPGRFPGEAEALGLEEASETSGGQWEHKA